MRKVELLPTRDCEAGYGLGYVPEGRGHSNTSVVHMRDQMFSKHTLNAISCLQEKHLKGE